MYQKALNFRDSQRSRFCRSCFAAFAAQMARRLPSWSKRLNNRVEAKKYLQSSISSGLVILVTVRKSKTLSDLGNYLIGCLVAFVGYVSGTRTSKDCWRFKYEIGAALLATVSKPYDMKTPLVKPITPPNNDEESKPRKRRPMDRASFLRTSLPPRSLCVWPRMGPKIRCVSTRSCSVL